jgi:hypothetical protein
MGLSGGYRERRWLAEQFRRGDFRPRVGYFAAVRHPLPCFILMLVLLAIYETGVARLSAPDGTSLRAGIELWILDWLSPFGPLPPFVIPATALSLLLLWTLWKWRDRPENLFIALFGVIIEGMVFGLGLWLACLNAPALLEQSGLSLAAIDGLDSRLITFLGVGVYEEVAFRLILAAWLARILHIVFVPWVAAIPMAIVVSAVTFALAHHLVQSEPFVPMVFAMRALIGTYLALVFWMRGLGVAIGAHIVYNVMASLPHE